MSEETPPKRRGRKKDHTRRLEGEAKVVALFGELPVVEPPIDPDQVRPQNDNNGRQGGATGRRTVRMGKRMSVLYDDIESGRITMQQVVEAMDVEELARGQLRAKDGSFRGAPPRWVPAEFHGACMKEMLKRGQAMYRENFLVAIQAFTEIANSKDVEPQHRLKAAQYIWERVEGKIPDKVEFGGMTEPWEQLIGGIVAEAEDEAISRATAILGGAAEMGDS